MKLPFIPFGNSKGNKGKVKTDDMQVMEMIKEVIDYLNLSYNEALELKSDTFLLAYKCAILDKLNRTKEGREYLETCKRLNNSELDVKGFNTLKGE